MGEKRVLIFGEGRHELADRVGEALRGGDLPALPQLVHRILQEPVGVTYECRMWKDVKHVAGKGHKLARKVKRAILQATAQEFGAVVVLIDRDRNDDSELIVPLKEGRDSMSGLAGAACAVGAAVETFDAWMIADSNAVEMAGGDKSQCHPSPENLAGKEGTGNHPKDKVANIFGGSGGLGDRYKQIASAVRLKHLERCCPRGFAPFAEEVRTRLSPLVTEVGG
jgi:hypothetical protein